jgi:hypothetical protein
MESVRAIRIVLKGFIVFVSKSIKYNKFVNPELQSLGFFIFKI